MTYVDRDVVPGMRYGYRLAVSVAGREVHVGETEVTLPLVELAVRALRRAAEGRAALTLSLVGGAEANVEIYDVQGRLWGSQRIEGRTSGRREVTIAGRLRLGAGVYFVRLTQGGRTTNRRFALL